MVVVTCSGAGSGHSFTPGSSCDTRRTDVTHHIAFSPTAQHGQVGSSEFSGDGLNAKSTGHMAKQCSPEATQKVVQFLDQLYVHIINTSQCHVTASGYSIPSVTLPVSLIHQAVCAATLISHYEFKGTCA